MIDIRFLRENPKPSRKTSARNFRMPKLPLVDEVVDLDQKRRAAIAEVESLKAARNKLSKANGPLYGQLKKCEDEAKKLNSRHRSTKIMPPSKQTTTEEPSSISRSLRWTRASARSCM